MAGLGPSIKPILLDTFIELFEEAVNKLKHKKKTLMTYLMIYLNQMKISLKTSSNHFTSNHLKVTHGLSYGIEISKA